MHTQTLQAQPGQLIWHRRLTDGRPQSIDGVCTDEAGTIYGLYSGQSLADLNRRYPGAKVTAIDDYTQAHDAALTTAPRPISAEDYCQALDTLPPLDWHRRGDFECFKFIERYSGSITNIYARLGNRCWTWMDRDDLTADQIRHKLEAHADSARG